VGLSVDVVGSVVLSLSHCCGDKIKDENSLIVIVIRISRVIWTGSSVSIM
jgi:hypothetical protein